MPNIQFAYKAKDSSGKVKEGTVDAVDQKAAMARLREQKLSVLEIKQGVVKKAKNHLAAPGFCCNQATSRVSQTSGIDSMAQPLPNQSQFSAAESSSV